MPSIRFSVGVGKELLGNFGMGNIVGVAFCLLGKMGGVPQTIDLKKGHDFELPRVVKGREDQ
jgi:hypothetical protein